MDLVIRFCISRRDTECVAIFFFLDLEKIRKFYLMFARRVMDLKQFRGSKLIVYALNGLKYNPSPMIHY